MKKIFAVLIVAAVIALIVFILMMNKSKREVKLKAGEITSGYPVLVTPVKEDKLSDTLSLVGTIAPFNEVTVGSETMGRITGLYFDVGDRVGRGKTLVKVDDEVRSASLDNAQANFDKAEKDLARYEGLLKTQSITEVQYEQAKLVYAQTESALRIAARQLSDTRISSPLSGIVTQRMIEKGSVIAQGTPVAIIVNIDKLKIRVNVPEREAFRMKVGDRIDITTEIYPGVTFEGKIMNINSKSDEAHNYIVEIAMENSRANPLKAGMFARVYFKEISSGNTIIIPRSSLVGSIRNPQVFVIENNIAHLRTIVTGAEVGTLLEVLDGLTPGESVVTSGQINLKDSASVTIVKE